ncbi:multidrug ABC transporter [Gemmatimonadetes bacterium T265]|nr:multidrug ABC transporter [Gemmatimonadetes bacterium T265]
MNARGLFDGLAEQRRLVYLLVALLSVAGIWAGLRMPSAIYPELAFSRIGIVAEGGALDARQEVFSITRPLEEAISVVPGVTRVTSRSIRGGSELSVTFTPSTDMAYALQQVQARVGEARTTFPADVNVQVERLTPSVFPILSYNLEGGDAATLYDIARYQIRPVLSRVPGVGRVDVQGSDVREIEVVADPARLAAQGLAYDDLANAIRQSTAIRAVGRVTNAYQQYLVVAAQDARSAEDVGNVVVTRGLRVRDLATVTPGVEDRTHVIAGDGRPAASLNITRQPGGNTLALADSVAGVARALAPTLPPGVHLVPVYDQAALVRDAVASVRDAMLIGAALAVVVLLVFLRHARVTAISASSIPLTMAITVGAMSLAGQTFNLMTLGALAIAVGLVIDDAVVVTENIIRHLRLTPDRAVAVRDALRELVWPVTTSTLTTVVVFLPLRLLEGVVGQFFAALSITLTIAVLVSLVLSLTIIPLLSERFLRDADVEDERNPEARRGVLARLSGGLDALSARYERSLAHVLPRGRLVALGALVLAALGVLAGRTVGTGFLPEMDEGAFVLDYHTPAGTTLAESDRLVHQAERILLSTPEITATSRRLGAELGLFATLQNRGDIVVRLLPPSQRARRIDAVIDEVRGRIAEQVPRLRVEFVQILSDVINDLAGAARPVEIKLFGPDLNALEAYAKRLSVPVGKVAGLEDVFNGVADASPELAMHVLAPEAARLGMTPDQVAADASGALLGVPAGEIRLDDRAVAVRVRAPDSVRYDPARLAALPIVAAPGRPPTALGALATFEPTATRAELLRENQQQMVVITADVGERALGDVMTDVRAAIAATPPPAGIRLELGGQYAGQQASFRAFLLVMALAAASVVAIMVVQFRSFVEPLVILLAAPLSFVGAVALLMLTKTPLNVSSLMGLILLVGLVVKNGIILLDFTRHRMTSEGVPLAVALREAGRVRLRPILMTTLCTLFGLLPLALGLGAGSELQKPLALAVIGGLALSTPITLYLVPAFIVAVRGADYRLAPSAPTPTAPDVSADAPLSRRPIAA